jgi:Ni/Fe-hydrogenase 1 B-type cytochrome subunit
MAAVSTDEPQGAAESAGPAIATPSSIPEGQHTTSVVVYEVPVRIWHWVNALAMLCLCITGYFIGQPLPSVMGEASDHYVMGTIRFVHFASAYVFAVGLLARVYWAFVGNRHARELFTLPVQRKSYWVDLWRVLRWYAFLTPSPGRYVGHNPLARLSMFTGYSLLSLFMLCTGFALYGEGSQTGSWADRWFGWMIPLLGQSQNVHTLHRLGMWASVVFVIVHIYAVVRDDIVGKQSIVSSMVSGRRAFKD